MTPRYTRLEAAQRRDQILDAANALFAERGYDEVSIEDIASAAGVTRGLVHHYFGGRKEVYLALVDRLGNVRVERLRPPRGRSPRARLADSVYPAGSAGPRRTGRSGSPQCSARHAAGVYRRRGTAIKDRAARAKVRGGGLHGSASSRSHT